LCSCSPVRARCVLRTLRAQVRWCTLHERMRSPMIVEDDPLLASPGLAFGAQASSSRRSSKSVAHCAELGGSPVLAPRELCFDEVSDDEGAVATFGSPRKEAPGAQHGLTPSTMLSPPGTPPAARSTSTTSRGPTPSRRAPAPIFGETPPLPRPIEVGLASAEVWSAAPWQASTASAHPGNPLLEVCSAAPWQASTASAAPGNSHMEVPPWPSEAAPDRYRLDSGGTPTQLGHRGLDGKSPGKFAVGLSLSFEELPASFRDSVSHLSYVEQEEEIARFLDCLRQTTSPAASSPLEVSAEAAATASGTSASRSMECGGDVAAGTHQADNSAASSEARCGPCQESSDGRSTIRSMGAPLGKLHAGTMSTPPPAGGLGWGQPLLTPHNINTPPTRTPSSADVMGGRLFSEEHSFSSSASSGIKGSMWTSGLSPAPEHGHHASAPNDVAIGPCARTLPVPASVPGVEEFLDADQCLHPCSHCGRRFRTDRLAVHEGVCRHAASSAAPRRPVFESRRQRCSDIESRWWMKGSDETHTLVAAQVHNAGGASQARTGTPAGRRASSTPGAAVGSARRPQANSPERDRGCAPRAKAQAASENLSRERNSPQQPQGAKARGLRRGIVSSQVKLRRNLSTTAPTQSLKEQQSKTSPPPTSRERSAPARRTEKEKEQAARLPRQSMGAQPPTQGLHRSGSAGMIRHQPRQTARPRAVQPNASSWAQRRQSSPGVASKQRGGNACATAAISRENSGSPPAPAAAEGNARKPVMSRQPCCSSQFAPTCPATRAEIMPEFSGTSSELLSSSPTASYNLEIGRLQQSDRGSQLGDVPKPGLLSDLDVLPNLHKRGPEGGGPIVAAQEEECECDNTCTSSVDALDADVVPEGVGSPRSQGSSASLSRLSDPAVLASMMEDYALLGAQVDKLIYSQQRLLGSGSLSGAIAPTSGGDSLSGSLRFSSSLTTTEGLPSPDTVCEAASPRSCRPPYDPSRYCSMGNTWPRDSAFATSTPRPDADAGAGEMARLSHMVDSLERQSLLFQGRIRDCAQRVLERRCHSELWLQGVGKEV